ncbi:MAG: exo-alpha-sialidase [Phycisphaerae bacterium]|nr:exo-alpha-sialidase [Phycisphaerae bacterium]
MNTPRPEQTVSALLVAAASLGAVRALASGTGDAQTGCQWYRQDALARELSQLTEQEIAKFAGSPLIDVRPVIVPHPENVVGANDYFMWPIATKVDDTLVVLYARCPCHWGKDKSKGDGNAGIRMVVTSSDGGKTWTKPVDVLRAGKWTNSPFKGFGGGLGAQDGVVYLALNQGVYRSRDKGRSWELVSASPSFQGVPQQLWAPGMRLTFDTEHGMTVWTTAGFAPARKETKDYGNRLCAVYSRDGGKTWRYQDQALPEGIGLSEITPVQFDRKIAFLLRNGLKNTRYAQAYSQTGWFPFRFDITNIGPVQIVDTPDIAYNPATRRLEAAVSHRGGTGPGPKGSMKINLYAIAPSDMKAGSANWRFEGTLIRYRWPFGKSDGFNPVGSVIDTHADRQYLHVWAGDCTGRAAIFQLSRSLDTPAVSRYLTTFYDTVSTRDALQGSATTKSGGSDTTPEGPR